MHPLLALLLGCKPVQERPLARPSSCTKMHAISARKAPLCTRAEHHALATNVQNNRKNLMKATGHGACREITKIGTPPAIVRITQFRGPWYRQAGDSPLSLGALVQAGRELPSFFGDSGTGRPDHPLFTSGALVQAGQELPSFFKESRYRQAEAPFLLPAKYPPRLPCHSGLAGAR